MAVGSISTDRDFRDYKRADYVGIIRMLCSRWYWLASAMIAGLMLGHCYLIYAPKLYTTSAILKFDDRKSEISELINVRNVYDRTNKVESEKSIIRSRTVILRALKSLGYEVSFYTMNGLQEEYPFNPFKITILEKSRVRHYSNFIIYAIDTAKYHLCYTYQNTRKCKVCLFNSDIKLLGLQFSIAKGSCDLEKKEAFAFRFNDVTELAERINRSLKLDASQNINLLNLHFSDYNPRFAGDMLNAIIQEYLAFDRLQRSATASQTSTFISSLLQTMADTLDSSGQEVQRYKQINHSIISASNLNLITGLLSTLEAEQHQLELNQLSMANLEESLRRSTNHNHYTLQGTTDGQLNFAFDKINEMISNKKKALYTYTENSEIIKRFDKELADLKIDIQNNLSKQREFNKNKSLFLLKQIDSLNSILSKAPKAEKELAKLEATSNVNQKVYSYLAEKKLEAEITKAAVTSGALIIDKASFPEEAVSPLPFYTYLYSALFSLLTAIGVICSIRILNPYVYNKEGIEQLSQTPIIGVIRKCDSDVINRHNAITEKPRSLFSESIRSVRSNLSFFAFERNSRIICLTSEISGEGKSFVSTNLAISLTLTEKKVLLIAADLRRSKLHENFGLSNKNGLSSYLSGQTDLPSILMQTGIDNLTVIPSGQIPPNPSELLHSIKMRDLMFKLKESYDFIILDSAPVGLVTDAKPLMKMADLTLFILRAGKSKRHFAATPDHLKVELGLNDLAIILNGFQDNSFYKSYQSENYMTKAHARYYHPDQGNSDYQNYFEL